VDAPSHWGTWLKENPMYENVGEDGLWTPIGPWMTDVGQRWLEVGELVRTNARQLFPHLGTLSIQAGWNGETVARWVSTADKEFEEMEPKLFGRWCSVWATRKA